MGASATGAALPARLDAGGVLHQVSGFEGGAKSILTTPFDISELLLPVRAPRPKRARNRTRRDRLDLAAVRSATAMRALELYQS